MTKDEVISATNKAFEAAYREGFSDGSTSEANYGSIYAINASVGWEQSEAKRLVSVNAG